MNRCRIADAVQVDAKKVIKAEVQIHRISNPIPFSFYAMQVIGGIEGKPLKAKRGMPVPDAESSPALPFDLLSESCRKESPQICALHRTGGPLH